MSFQRKILIIKSEIYPIVSKHYPKNTHREIISLYDLITFAILAHLHFNGVYKYLSDFRRRIETLFSKFSEFLLRPSRSVSLRGLAVRILGVILAVNLDRLYNFTGGGN